MIKPDRVQLIKNLLNTSAFSLEEASEHLDWCIKEIDRLRPIEEIARAIVFGGDHEGDRHQAAMRRRLVNHPRPE